MTELFTAAPVLNGATGNVAPASPPARRRPPLTEQLSCDMDTSSASASLPCQRSNDSNRSRSSEEDGGGGDMAEVCSEDSAIFGSGEAGTRRNSNAFTEFREQVERASSTNGKVACKMSAHHRYGAGIFTARCSPRTYSLSEAKTAAALRCLAARKTSNADSLLDFLDAGATAEEQFDEEQDVREEDGEEGMMARISYRRRFSVPERTLLTANYAILRKSVDQRVEIVGAFQKSNSDAYKSFLQSLTCYDLTPPHGVVIMLDAELTIHKAVTIMCLNAGHRAAMVCKAKNRDRELGIFTVTDCLHVLKLAAAAEKQAAAESNHTTATPANIGEQTLQCFLDNVQLKKKMITSASTMSAWDVARLFRLNRIHRIPIFQVDDMLQTNEVLSLVCLRAIFLEILKLFDSKCVLEPNLHLLTLEQTRIGTWSNITWLGRGATLAECIDSFIERRVSCIPLLDEERRLIAFVTKDALIDAIAHKFNAYLDVLELPLMAVLLETGSDHLALHTMVVQPSATIEQLTRMMVANHRQCVFVADANGRLAGVCSFADIMDFLLNTC